jgi:hypothetical protein
MNPCDGVMIGGTAGKFVAGWIRAWDAEAADGQRVNAATDNDDFEDPLELHVCRVLTNAILARVDHETKTCQEVETLSKPDETYELKYAEVIAGLFQDICGGLTLEASEYTVEAEADDDDEEDEDEASASAGQKRPREEQARPSAPAPAPFVFGAPIPAPMGGSPPPPKRHNTAALAEGVMDEIEGDFEEGGLEQLEALL